MRHWMALAAGCAALVFPLAAAAQDDPATVWHFMAADESGAWAYSKAGAPINGALIAVYNAEMDTTAAPASHGVVMGLEIDCAGNKARNVLEVWYDENLARIPGESTEPLDWQPLEPEQYGFDAVMTGICAGTPDPGHGDLTGDGAAAQAWLKTKFEQQ